MAHPLVRPCPEQKLKKRCAAVWKSKILQSYCNKATCTVAALPLYKLSYLCAFWYTAQKFTEPSCKVLISLSCRPVILSVQYIVHRYVPKLLKHPKTSFRRATYSSVTCRPKTVSWPPVPRRLREIRGHDVTHSPYLLWKRRLGTVLELGEIIAVWDLRQLKKKGRKMWGDPIICDGRNNGLFWAVFEDLRRDEEKFLIILEFR
jgi:hypothetical protein